eukprot:scaffold106020_cov28-Tisochrysis_lutea.AAC.4
MTKKPRRLAPGCGAPFRGRAYDRDELMGQVHCGRDATNGFTQLPHRLDRRHCNWLEGDRNWASRCCAVAPETRRAASFPMRCSMAMDCGAKRSTANKVVQMLPSREGRKCPALLV